MMMMTSKTLRYANAGPSQTVLPTVESGRRQEKGVVLPSLHTKNSTSVDSKESSGSQEGLTKSNIEKANLNKNLKDNDFQDVEMGSQVDEASVNGADNTNTDGSKSSAGTTSITGENGEGGSSSNSRFSLARQETANIFKLRVMVISVLLIAALTVSVIVYLMSKGAEKSEYNDQYNAAAKVVLDAFLDIMDSKMGVVSTLGVALIAHAVETSDVFPYITLSNFHERAATAVKQSGTILLHTSPFVTVENREEWERYAAGNASDWIQEGRDYQKFIGMFDFETDSFSQDDVLDFNVTGTRPIWRLNSDDVHVIETGPGPYMPVWQTTPVTSGGLGVNKNLFGSDIDKAGARICIETGSFVMGNMLTPPPPGQENEAYIEDDEIRIDYVSQDMAALVSTLLSIVKREKVEYEGGPISHVYFPIFDSFGENRNPKAVMTAWIHWMDYFKNILPSIMEGIDVVLTNTCDAAVFTMRIMGERVEAIGRGDYHEVAFDEMRRNGSFSSVDNIADGTRLGLPFNKDHCVVNVDVYPSEMFYKIYNTNTPIVVTCAVAFVFVIAVILFFVYDYLIQQRQIMVMDRAHKTQKMVSSLFPADVAERMMEQAAQDKIDKKNAKGGAFLTPNQQFTGILAGTHEDIRGQNDSPIADLFPHCTVLFADIAGFTAWSSAREPAQVFILLQTIYEAFDKVAKRRKVFKVETIGDSYVAVTGLPEPQKSHAVIMTRFAGECMNKMKEVANVLETRLGPDTAELSMRFGLHSGPVTAGVLRGAKSRFQLFGDSVNTASRMESTGIPGKIQISESTYKLLVEAGKEKWLRNRSDAVTAKGKGTVKTWWVNPSMRRGSSAAGSATDASSDIGSMHDGPVVAATLIPSYRRALIGDEMSAGEAFIFRNKNLLCNKDTRLVTWIVDMLHEHLQKVVAMRKSAKTSSAPAEIKNVAYHQPAVGQNSMDEVQDVLATPDFCERAFNDVQDYRSVQVSPKAMAQLFDLITTFAGMYHKNAFHNFEHACHVTMSVSKFIKRITSPGIAKVDDDSQHNFTIGINSDPLTVMAIIFSAVIHDVDHRGVSNQRLAEERPDLGEKYHYKSVAEQNSLDLSWALMMEDRFVDLRDVLFTTDEEMTRFRQVLVNVVLATDIFDKDLNDMRKGRWEKAFHASNSSLTHDEVDNIRSSIVIEHIIQASDVSHSMQHWHIYRKWNKKLFEEMYKAYKEGRMAKDPSTFWYNGEIGFFDNYILPLAQKLKDCQVFGVTSYECLDYATQNRNEWKERGQQIVEDMVKELNHQPVLLKELPPLVEVEKEVLTEAIALPAIGDEVAAIAVPQAA